MTSATDPIDNVMLVKKNLPFSIIYCDVIISNLRGYIHSFMKAQNNIRVCNHDITVSYSIMDELVERQAGAGRHKCCVCAFDLGFKIATSDLFDNTNDYFNTVNDKFKCKEGLVSSNKMMSSLPESQAGPERHKCATCAFNLGLEAGFSDPINNLSSSKFLFTETKPPSGLLLEASSSGFSHKNREDKEKENKKLGNAGELAVIEMEKSKLLNDGYKDLSKEVQQVSSTIGDHLGYDVLSFFPPMSNPKKEKFIEVKTTLGNSETPFHISANQIAKSEEYGNKYYLYRLYNFDPVKLECSYFILHGELSRHLNLIPTSFKALPK